MKFYQKYIDFMRGRYGVIDTVNKLCLIMGLFILLLAILPNFQVLKWGSYALFMYSYFRFFSKKIYLRSNENQKVQAKIKGIKTNLRIRKEAVQQRHNFRYFRCKNCKQMLRVPRRHGKIKIRCTKCEHEWIKKF